MPGPYHAEEDGGIPRQGHDGERGSLRPDASNQAGRDRDRRDGGASGDRLEGPDEARRRSDIPCNESGHANEHRSVEGGDISPLSPDELEQGVRPEVPRGHDVRIGMVYGHDPPIHRVVVDVA